MDVSSSYLSKNFLLASGILLAWGDKRSPNFFWYLDILIAAAVQSNPLLFAIGGKFESDKSQPIRRR